ncbi:hypothetical protein [Spirosoma radiotolerans]|uniref:Uncharacterized protein n=1 Tax=Spirosoma radiotolerans TaxID=1379870 RepID=A0A0E3V8A3_9BACT|nr:hypothetical protein [Spirosoma radiotolerans]AKD56131.1 hypothetical protein SD10_15730 [Spirosoma radiotolerans]
MNHFASASSWSFLKALFILTTVGLAVGCQEISDIKNIDPLKGVVFKLNYQPAKAQVQGLVVDAKTGMPLDIPIQVSIQGKDAGRTVTFDGKALTTYTAPKGDLFIGLKGEVPTATAPAELRVVVNAAGYVASGVNLTLKRALNDAFIIRLVKIMATPAGVAAKVDEVTASAAGVLTVDKLIQVTTPASASVASMAMSVFFSAGTVVKDSKGQPVTGKIPTSLVAYSGQSQEALQAFPGGLNAPVAKDVQGRTDIKGIFDPIGFVAIDMKKSTNQAVSAFSKPVTLQMSIPANRFNSSTGQPVKEGDRLEVYSYSETTGVWTFEREVLAERKGNDLMANVPINHLSYYALTIPRTSTTCRVTYTVRGLPEGYSVNYTLRKFDQGLSGSSVVVSSGNSSDNTADRVFEFDVPAGNYEFSILDPVSNNDVMSSTKATNPCGAISLNVTPPARVDASFTVRAKCENGNNIEVYPTVTIFYGEVGKAYSGGSASFVNGKGVLKGLKPNAKYQACIHYEGEYCVEFTMTDASSERTLDYILKANSPTCNN